MKRIIAIAALICCPLLNLSAQGFPQADISNKIIKAKFYLPDTQKGYYQGTRFDWSGVMPELEYKGHSFFAQWFDNYDPKTHDAILGPVEEFFELGYNEAKPGEEFLRIGIGGLKKPEEDGFKRFGLYEISNPGKWHIKTDADRVTFTHILDNVAGYSYVYTKTVLLKEGEPKLVLQHSLKNTGKKTIETVAYNHNFFVIDNQPIGPEIVIKFPFDIVGKWNNPNGPSVIDGKNIKYTRELNARESVMIEEVKGHNNSISDYDFRIENLKTGAGVRFTCNRPVSKIVFWSNPKTSCPEPYIDINVKPGEEFAWDTTYEFYTFTSQK